MVDSSGQMEIPMHQPKGRNLELVSTRDEPSPPSMTETMARQAASLADKERELQQAIGILRVALGALSQRLLTVVSLLASAGMFGWAVWQPEGWRITAACLFAVLVFGPLAYLDARSRHA